MPTIALPPQPTYSIVCNGAERALAESYSYGDEASQLSVLADEMCSHWSQRVEILVPALEVLNGDSYVSVPPNRVSFVKTRYVYLGKGTPMPFDLSDE